MSSPWVRDLFWDVLGLDRGDGCVTSKVELFFFLDVCYIAQASLNLKFLLPLPSECWGSRCALPHLACAVLEIRPRVSFIPGKHRTS